MRTLFLECQMGAAGDMLMAALLELIPDREAFLAKMNALGLPGVRVEAVPSVKCGITGTHIRVTVGEQEEHSHDVHEHGHGHTHDHEHSHDHSHDHEHSHNHDHTHAHDHGYTNDQDHTHEHSHSGMGEIESVINGLAVSARVKRDALAVYRLIAEAESHAHGTPVEQIHFHEVGSLDAIADVVGVCLLMEELSPGKVLATPIHVGSGQARCSHGILPVPAPATAHILRGVPIYGGSIKGELCTPTGAALLKHFVSSFGNMPPMTVAATGYGMGTKDFPAANCVRASIGDALEDGGEAEGATDEILSLSCNLDDMTPESIAYAQRALMDGGALDAYTVSIGMKKGRPGILLCCLCRVSDKMKMVRLLFTNTTTLGVREESHKRYLLTRSERSIDTPDGPVRIKGSTGYGVTREKAEYEDLARIARLRGESLESVRLGIEWTD